VAGQRGSLARGEHAARDERGWRPRAVRLGPSRARAARSDSRNVGVVFRTVVRRSWVIHAPHVLGTVAGGPAACVQRPGPCGRRPGPVGPSSLAGRACRRAGWCPVATVCKGGGRGSGGEAWHLDGPSWRPVVLWSALPWVACWRSWSPAGWRRSPRSPARGWWHRRVSRAACCWWGPVSVCSSAAGSPCAWVVRRTRGWPRCWCWPCCLSPPRWSSWPVGSAPRWPRSQASCSPAVRSQGCGGSWSV